MIVTVKDGNSISYDIILEAFGKDIVSFGRSKDNDIILKCEHASRVHGCFYLENGIWHIKDLDSTNGIFIDGIRADEKRLDDGMKLVITTSRERDEIVSMTLKEEHPVTKNSNAKKMLCVVAGIIIFLGIIGIIVGSVMSKPKNKNSKSDVVESCYRDVKSLYDEGDYYNAMLSANEVLENDKLQGEPYYEELQDLYDTCYSEMKTTYLKKMEQLYVDNNAYDYEIYRERMQEIYGADSMAVEEINNNIKLFSTDYMVLSEREISDYGDDVYTYVYDDENGSVTVDKIYIAANLYSPELESKMVFYYTDTVQFFDSDSINIQYDTYIDDTRKVELTFDEEGKVISSYRYEYETGNETYTEFMYDEYGKCVGWSEDYGDEEIKVDVTYNESGNLFDAHMYSVNYQEEYMNAYYYYDAENRVTSYEGISWGWDVYGRFEYDDVNKIVYYYDDFYDDEPQSTMYYDERGVCYKEVSDFSEIYYEYREVLKNPSFGTELELYLEDAGMETIDETNEEEWEETTTLTTEEIDISDACALNTDILGVNLYDNYSPETEYTEVTKAQVADMVFYDNMSYNEFVSVVENSAFDCSGYIGDPEIILTPYQGMDLIVSINGEEVFEAGIFNMGDESVRFKECSLTHVSMIEGTSWSWYNSYGIGAYGENVPDYFTFIETLDSYDIIYDEGTADDGNLEIKLIKEKPDDRYYAVCSFVFDRYYGECLYTSWDKGEILVPEIGTADPYR